VKGADVFQALGELVLGNVLSESFMPVVSPSDFVISLGHIFLFVSLIRGFSLGRPLKINIA
jgi:hypothetical protein